VWNVDKNFEEISNSNPNGKQGNEEGGVVEGKERTPKKESSTSEGIRRERWKRRKCDELCKNESWGA